MKEIEDYFKVHGINSFKKRDTGVVTYYETSEGDFVLDEKLNFFKFEKNGKQQRIELKDPAMPASK